MSQWAGGCQEFKKGRAIVSRRSDGKLVLQMCNQFAQDWVANTNAGALVEHGLSLIFLELTWLHCSGSSADNLFQLLASQKRWSYSSLS